MRVLVTFGTVVIDYSIQLDDGRAFQFRVNLDRKFDAKVDAAEHPFWTKLDFKQCENCPLSREQFHHCPVALDIEEMIVTFRSILSYATVNVEVRADERVYSKRTDVQTALRSLMGLIMATSACPILSRFKGQARFHLPFASMEETLFRTTGAYLIQQFFVFRDGGKPDLELKGLDAFYGELQTVNRCFKERIDAASEQDANMNAVASLVYLSMGVSFSLADRLEDLRAIIHLPPAGH